MRITPAEIAALSLSIKVALFSLVIMFPPGLLVGWLLAKRTFPGKAFLNTLVMCPLVLPPIVSGYVLLILFGRHGFIGGFIYQIFGIEIVFSQVAVIIAVSIISFPLLVRGIVTGMESVPLELENAARTLGCITTEGVLDDNVPTCVSRNCRWNDPRFLQKSWGVWCHYHGRRKHSRQNPDDGVSDFQCCTSRRRCFRLSTGVYFNRCCLHSTLVNRTLHAPLNIKI